jgi:hypothetical protein
VYISITYNGGMLDYNIVEGNMYNDNSDGEDEIEEGED